MCIWLMKLFRDTFMFIICLNVSKEGDFYFILLLISKYLSKQKKWWDKKMYSSVFMVNMCDNIIKIKK